MAGSENILKEMKTLLTDSDYVRNYIPEKDLPDYSVIIRDRAGYEQIPKNKLPAIVLSMGNISPTTEYPGDNPTYNAKMKVLIEYVFEEKNEENAVYYGCRMVDGLIGMFALDQTINGKCISAKITEGYIGMYSEGAVRTIYTTSEIIYRVPEATPLVK